MIFRMDYSIPVENLSKAQERFATMEENWDGLKLIGRWQEAGSRGFMVVEADDSLSSCNFTNQWVDLCEINIVPLMNDEEVGEVLSSG